MLNEPSSQIHEYIKWKKQLDQNVIVFFSNYDEKKINIISNILIKDIRNIWIDKIQKNKYITDDFLISFLKNHILKNKTLFLGSLLYISKTNNEEIKAEKTLYYLLLENIINTLIEILDWYDYLDDSINKQNTKDLFVIIFFSIITSAIISYLFYFYLWKFFS